MKIFNEMKELLMSKYYDYFEEQEHTPDTDIAAFI